MTRLSWVMILLLLGLHLAAADGARQVPPAVAELLARAAAAPADAVRLVDGWSGEAHPLLLLCRAQARWRLAQDDADGGRREAAAAERDYREALRLDPALRQAHLGLAQCAARREDWLTASREAAAGIDPAAADHDQLAFLAAMAVRAGDWRLGAVAAQQGILRFPDDQRLRRLELEVLVHAGRPEDARQAVLALLGRAPGDAELWRFLAWAARETGRHGEALAALEAALACHPDDRVLRRQLAEAQLAQDLPQAALATVRPLLGEPPTDTALADAPLMLLASRAAAAGGALAQARAWLAAVPVDRRSRELALQTARLAMQAGDATAAGDAIAALIAAGERDAAILGWAAALADAQGDTPRAEALYQQAAGGTGPAAANAGLRLVAFLIRHDRRDEAQAALAAYLARRPDDAQARALQAQLGR